MKPKVGILGMGAIGSVISSLLKENPRLRLFFYSRTPKHRVHIRLNGIERKISFDDLNNFDTTLDWLIICIKEHQYSDAGQVLSKLIGPETKVVSIRNGLNHKVPLVKLTSGEDILECIIDSPTQLNGQGIYDVLQMPKLTLPKNGLAQEFERLFVKSNIIIEQNSDFKTACWKKICTSSALGAILCLSGETCWIFHDKEVQGLYQAILQESLQVARADGANIEVSFVDKMITELLSYPPEKSSSMLNDRRNGNPIELGAKNGVIVEMGKRNGIPTPVNDLIVTLLKKTNNRTLEDMYKPLSDI